MPVRRPSARRRSGGRSTTRGGSRRASPRSRSRRASPTSPIGRPSGADGDRDGRSCARLLGPASRGPCQTASARRRTRPPPTGEPVEVADQADADERERDSASASGTRDSAGISSAASRSPVERRSSRASGGPRGGRGRSGPHVGRPSRVGASDDRDPVEVVRRRRRGRRPLERVAAPRIVAGRRAATRLAARRSRAIDEDPEGEHERADRREQVETSQPMPAGTCRRGAASRAGRRCASGRTSRLKPTKTSQKLACAEPLVEHAAR